MSLESSSLQLAPQSRNIDFNHVAETLPVEVVKVFEQLRLGYHRAGTVSKIFQHAILHRRQDDDLALTTHREISGADLDVSNSQHGGTLALAATDERLGPRQQFTQVEGLGDVIVGASVQQGDDRLLFVARGQDQYGNVSATTRKLLSSVRPSSFGSIRSRISRSYGLVCAM